MGYAYSSMMIMGLYNKHLTKLTYLIFRNSIPFNWNMGKQLFLLLLLTIVQGEKISMQPLCQDGDIITSWTYCYHYWQWELLTLQIFCFIFVKFNGTLCTYMYLYMDQIFGIESVLPSVFTNDRCRNSSTTCSVSSIHVDNTTHTYMYDVNYTDTTPFRYFTGLDIYFTETKCTQLFLLLVNFKTLTTLTCLIFFLITTHLIILVKGV